MRSRKIVLPAVCFIFALEVLLTACGGGSSSATTPVTPPPTGQVTHVYVVFPPASGVNNTHFMSTVMNQNAIEGVTVAVSWNDVETGTPGTGTCNNPGTDSCQMDSAGFTHTYDWSVVDSNNAQWFAVGSKKVNLILNGIGGASPLCAQTNSCINPLTPYYVTTSGWAGMLASGMQDVINGVKDGCTNDVGLNTSSMTRDSSGLVTVTQPNLAYKNGDTIWITGAVPTDFNVTSQQGVQVQSVNTGANTFQYQSPGTSSGSATTTGTVISRQQSYPVPYETPYKTGWEAFIAAAVIHFNNSPNFSQIDYMRVGRSVGGEAYPYCIPTMEALPAPNTYSKSGWLAYYTAIDDFVQSQSPKMVILDPLNEAGSGASRDPSYGTAEAQTAMKHQNANGVVNGFGSQGLQASDITNYPSCASDWCNQFNAYFATNDNLELQQLSLSAPVAVSGVNSGTGDLRLLLPFAVSHHMTILELYNLDALLAYDPNYCVLNVPDNGLCAPGSVQIPTIVLPATAQEPYFQAVGQKGQAGATGDGSYAAVINQTNGQH